jgi:Polyketide cyclase / dehydrase and lipid transport
VTTYRFRSAWHLPATVDAAWEAVSDAECWPQWWPAVSSAEVLERGDPHPLGQTVRFRLRAPLGYRLAVRTRVVDADPPRMITADVLGQLQGRGRWELQAEPGGVRVDQLWEVDVTRRWMRVLSPVAAPLFRWSHDRAARRGGDGLARWLADRGQAPLSPRAQPGPPGAPAPSRRRRSR